MANDLWHGNWRGKIPDGDVHQRARTIVRPTGGIVRGKFPSRKNGRMVHHEGLLELDAIYLFEASPLIFRFREQPTTIRYPDGKRLRRYTPDFELILINGEVVVVEIKPARRLASTDMRRTFDCIEEHMQRSSVRFTILTDVELRQEPRLTNLKRIYHCASRVRPTSAALNTVISRHPDKFPTTIATASALFAAAGIDPYSALLAGQLHCKLDSAVDSNTILTLPKEGHHDWFRISEEHCF
ncbi:TnsA endonuclease N-terminal domain-containing protein [Massilia varians]|uniref:TnsA endonuclease N-terminal domain-containing protein n=1 Tax=Massilia varians TaxID=457921 RepID=UPI00255279A7|nr:TnsA endonuclease N-terminal domain-containing protein [Massilia varians]MDK6080581.1 TnsA endonuclease N-terminal domain-containing protein [Massilia varians]